MDDDLPRSDFIAVGSVVLTPDMQKGYVSSLHFKRGHAWVRVWDLPGAPSIIKYQISALTVLQSDPTDA